MDNSSVNERAVVEEIMADRDDPQGTGHKFTATIEATYSNGKIHYSVFSPLQKNDNGPLVFNKKNDGMPAEDYYLVDFILKDKTGLNLAFMKDLNDVLWVAMGEVGSNDFPPCPQNPAYSKNVFAVSVDGTGKKMTLQNNDPEIQNFQYSIGIVNGPRCDPGGTNQNGSSRT